MAKMKSLKTGLKKTHAAVIFAALLAVMLAACTNVPNIPDVSDTSSEASGADGESQPEAVLSAEEWMETLEERDYTGQKLVIATAAEGFVVPDDEEESGLIDAAAEKRNELIEDKYGVVIEEKKVQSSTLQSQLASAAASGTQYADAVLTTAREISSLAAGGGLLNLFSLPYFDMQAGYIDGALADDSVIGNTCYAIYGSATGVENSVWAVFYNKKLLSDAGYPSPEALVRNGEWTFDKMYEIAKTVAADTMNKRSPDSSRDIFGYSSYNNDDDWLMALWQSGAQKALGNDTDGHAALCYDYAASQAVLNTLNDFVNSKAMYPSAKSAVLSAFSEDRIAFLIYRLDFAATLAENGADWGLLPVPAILDAAGQVSPVDSNVFGLCVPAFLENSERTGILLNAFFAASHGHVRQAFVDNYVNYYLSDNDEALMLEHIIDAASVDASVLYADGYSGIASVTTDILTDIIKNGGTLQSRVEPLINTFENFVQNTFR